MCIALLEPRPSDQQPPSPTSSGGGGYAGGASPTTASGELRRMSLDTARGLQTAAVAGIAARAQRLRAMLDDSAAPPELVHGFFCLGFVLSIDF